MSTRAAIAEWTNKDKGEWQGQYHHWGGYPSGLGKSLYELCRRPKTTMAGWCEMLLAHTWSTINGADWTKKPGFNEKNNGKKSKRPQCYCHGDRHEEVSPPLTKDNASECGCEWVYVLDCERRTITVLECTHDDGSGHMVGMFGCGADGAKVFWQERAVVFVDNPEPDWEAMS